MNFEIRQGTTEDAPAISVLLKQSIPYVIEDMAQNGATRFLESFEESAVAERLCSSSYFHLLAVHSDHLLGFMALRDNRHLYHLFVRPEAHGKGIARELWSQLLAMAGPGPFTVNSSMFAVEAYRRLGFVQTDDPQVDGCPHYVPMLYPGSS